jgi:hypothetical protein
VSVLPTLCVSFDFPCCQPQPPHRSTASKLAYPYLSPSWTPTDSRINGQCIGRNSQRITTVTEWIGSIVFDSLWRGEAVWWCPHSGQAAVALATGALPRPPRAGSCQGSTCTPDASLETSALGESIGCSQGDRPPEVPIARSNARIREPESALHFLTPEARPERGVIPRVIRASSTLRPPSTSSWESLACSSHFHAPPTEEAECRPPQTS